MARGEQAHSVDAKGRYIVPSKFRDALGERFIITIGLDDCLFVYTMQEWAVFEEKIKNISVFDPAARKFVRVFFGKSHEAEVDSQGRVLLPQNLREYAKIQKDIVSIGVPGRIEIWAKELWNEYNGDISYDNGIAERMAELGI